MFNKLLRLIGRRPVEDQFDDDDYGYESESSLGRAKRSLNRKIGRLAGQASVKDEMSDYDDPSYKSGGSFGRLIVTILMFPVRVLLLPFQSLGLFHNSGVDLGYDQEELGTLQKLKYWLVRIVKGVVLLPFRLVMIPAHFLRSLTIASLSDLLFILPALMMVVLFGFVFAQVFARAGMIEERYKKGAQIAISNHDFALAKTFYERLRSDKELAPNQLFAWAEILARTGELERADEVFNKLAPDDRPGYGPAHGLKAIAISKSLGQSNDPKILSKLQHHLRNSYFESPEISQAWALFYLASENYDEAVKHLEKTADIHPRQYVTIASIRRSQGLKTECHQALQKAEKIYRKQLDKDQFNHPVRIQLADILAQLEQYDEAEALLLKGARLQPDDMIQQALSRFFILRHDVARQAKLDSGVQVQYLVRALNHNPNNGNVYQRLMVLYMESEKTDAAMIEVRETFQKIVSGDNPSSMAHFALSNVLWQEGKLNEAQFHLEQAYNMDNKILVVVNNLAWMLSHVENPDLERALELAETATSQAPRDARFRDTYGTILLKMERYKEASTELELALPGVTDKKRVHEKLALAYQKLGMDELSKLHQQKSLAEEKR